MPRYDISEGLTRNSLENLVLPLISLDEYESKISDKRVIVAAFYVTDEDPAKDLSAFIDRSGKMVLDTEVSPAPTTEGNYVVFVEIQRGESFPKVLLDILDQVENLCGDQDWSFICPGHPEPIDLSSESMKDNLILDPSEIEEISDDPAADEKEGIKEDQEFWRHSVVTSVLIEGSTITFQPHIGSPHQFKMVQAPKDRTTILPNCQDGRILQTVLGPAYAVFSTTQGFIVENGTHHRYLVKND